MKTTKKHFQYFRERCEYWAQLLGLQRWEISYDHSADNDDNLASCHSNKIGRTTTIVLHYNWASYPSISDSEIDEVALHEMLELLMLPATDRFTTWDDHCSLRHEVINIIQKILVRLNNLENEKDQPCKTAKK